MKIIFYSFFVILNLSTTIFSQGKKEALKELRFIKTQKGVTGYTFDGLFFNKRTYSSKKDIRIQKKRHKYPTIYYYHTFKKKK